MDNSVNVCKKYHGHAEMNKTENDSKDAHVVNRKVMSTNSWHAFLALEAKRFRYAFKYDPILAVSVSKVDPLPHQIEAVYKYVLGKSRIRFMLAHDPGAGKTIMAGLIIKELKMRGDIRRVLIVVPGQLKEQWRWELQDKFDEDFTIVDRSSFADDSRAEIWAGESLITSIDFAKQDDVISSMNGARFDLIIVDEAHKMSAYLHGSSTSKTRRYMLGETLSVMSRHIMFLTATPHKGDTQNFRLLLDLLEPGFFATDDMMEESIKNQDNPLFLRRAKEDMVDFDGRPLFAPRSVMTPDVRLSAPEKKLYNAMSRYITEQYNLATRSVKRHNITFALIILQRRFASSTFALLESLRRRRNKLRQMEGGTGRKDAIRQAQAGSYGYTEGMTEKEQWDEEKRWELISMAKNKKELGMEIRILDNLITMAEKIIDDGYEAKLNQLKSTMKEMDRHHPEKKILVFTESRDTLNYLVRNIQSWGYSVNTIHGAMPAGERKDAEAVFRDRTRVMVATEAAGEGINLQFCHLMINYDLPWNPNRLEQRMGRIHRYGQRFPVSVFNLVAADTREGEIMQVLFEKLEEIKNAMGSDKIFDVISEVVQGKSLSQMLLDATVRARKQSEIISELKDSVAADNDRVIDYMKDSLATKYIDHTKLKGIREKALEMQMVPEYTRYLFGKILEAAGGRIDGNDDLASIQLPGGILGPARTKHGRQILPSYEAVTFDKKVRMAKPGIELITFGHPVFDAVLDWAEQEYSDAALGGSVFVDPTGIMDGHLVFCEGSVTDGSGRLAGRQMLACFVDRAGGSVRSVSPSVMLDLDMHPAAYEPGEDHDRVMKMAVAKSAEMMADYAGTLSRERDRHAMLVQRYGMKSLDTHMDMIRDDIMVLLAKKRRGARVDLAIRNKRESRRRYRTARRDMAAQARMDGNLSIGRTSVIGIARVLPGSEDAARLKHQALDSLIKFERSHGRKPELVSGEGYGFDVRSIDPSGSTRYILAKPASTTGSVVFTPNEWLRTKTLQENCYLYLHGGGGRKKPYVLRDPAGVLAVADTPSGYEADQDQVMALADMVGPGRFPTAV